MSNGFKSRYRGRQLKPSWCGRICPLNFGSPGLYNRNLWTHEVLDHLEIENARPVTLTTLFSKKRDPMMLPVHKALRGYYAR